MSGRNVIMIIGSNPVATTSVAAIVANSRGRTAAIGTVGATSVAAHVHRVADKAAAVPEPLASFAALGLKGDMVEGLTYINAHTARL